MLCRQEEHDVAQSPCALLAGCWWLFVRPRIAFRLVVPVLPSILLELVPRKGKASQNQLLADD